MIGNRRDFIKATMAVSAFTASQASAQAASVPWIGLIHSTRLDESWQSSFYSGLRSTQVWEGDPSANNQGGLLPVGIYIFEAGSRYDAGDISNLSRAVTNAISELGSQLKLIVAAGGMVSGLAAIGASVPCLAILGRSHNFGLQHVGGFYFDPINGSTNTNLVSKINYLYNNYGIGYDAMCLLYNGHSWMGSREVTEWTQQLKSLGVTNPLVSDAAGFGTGDNQSINLHNAIGDAINRLKAKAIVVSGDPHFTRKRANIVHAVGTKIVMCYPFQEYVDEIPASVSNNFYMVYGPKLASVYQNVGALAAQVLSSPSTQLSLTAVTPMYVGK